MYEATGYRMAPFLVKVSNLKGDLVISFTVQALVEALPLPPTRVLFAIGLQPRFFCGR